MPRRADELTAEWLSAALQSHGRDVIVRSVRRRPLGEGVGMVSGLEMLELDYERGDGPTTMVFKFPGTNDANRAVALAFDLYRRAVRVPLDEVKRYPNGHIFDDSSIVVEPKEPGWPQRLDVGHPGMMAELDDVAAEPLVEHAGYRSGEVFAYRLVSRRMLAGTAE